MNRTFGIIVSLAWLLSMTALIQRDVLPFWQAQDPPSQPIPPGTFQVAIHTEGGHRVGTTWLESNPSSINAVVRSMTRLNVGAVSKVLPMFSDLFLKTDLTYGQDATLDGFVFKLDTAALSAVVTAVRYEQEYACKARIGNIVKTMSFDSELSKYLGDSLRPFTHLKGLHVGQSWRLRLLDPLALLKGKTLEFSTQLVTVTKRETIEHRSRPIECYRIETDGTVAWADDSGRVVRQEIQIPFLGKWILTDEPYNAEARKKALQAVKHLQNKSSGGRRSARRVNR